MGKGRRWSLGFDGLVTEQEENVDLEGGGIERTLYPTGWGHGEGKGAVNGNSRVS